MKGTGHRHLPTIAAAVATAVLLLYAAGCTFSREEKAQELYGKAIEAFSNRKFGMSKQLLDSMKRTYHDMPKVVREAEDLLAMISRHEQERTLRYLDSLLLARDAEIKPLMANVCPEDKNAPEPTYVHKTQQIWRAIDRCYVRAYVDGKGDFYVASMFVGEKPIHHDHIKVMIGDEFVVSPTVSEEPFNHVFSDGEHVWEIVRSGDDIAKFIANNVDQRIVVAFEGEKAHYRSMMTETDKNAVKEVWLLGVLLRETVEIKSQIRSTRMAMKRKQM